MSRLRMVAAALAALAAGGCGGPEYEIGQVEGVVTLDGKPLTGALVEFHPDSSAGAKGPSSRGETDDQGRYHLRYSVPGKSGAQDGAVVGRHRVVVLDVKAAEDPMGVPRFAGKYIGVSSTPLREEVKSGEQTINLEVTAK